MHSMIIYTTTKPGHSSSIVMVSTILSLVTLFHQHLTIRPWTCVNVFFTVWHTFSKDVETRTTVQYSTPLWRFGSLVLCCHLPKTLNTQHAQWVKKSLGRVVSDREKRAEERHFWKTDKPNKQPQPEERNHLLAWHARQHTRCYASLTCPSKLCVYLLLYLNKL